MHPKQQNCDYKRPKSTELQIILVSLCWLIVNIRHLLAPHRDLCESDVFTAAPLRDSDCCVFIHKSALEQFVKPHLNSSHDAYTAACCRPIHGPVIHEHKHTHKGGDGVCAPRHESDGGETEEAQTATGESFWRTKRRAEAVPLRKTPAD